MNQKYRIQITELKTLVSHTAEVDFAMVHVGNMREDGLIQTESFLDGMSDEEMIRMYLALGRAIQETQFGHISEDIGSIVSPHIFVTRGLRRHSGIIEDNYPSPEDSKICDIEEEVDKALASNYNIDKYPYQCYTSSNNNGTFTIHWIELNTRRVKSFVIGSEPKNNLESEIQSLWNLMMGEEYGK